MRLQIKPTDPKVKEIKKKAEALGLSVKVFKTKVQIKVSMDASAKVKKEFVKLIRMSDFYCLLP